MIDENINNIQDTFFLFTSDNLEKVETDLYGYVIYDKEIIINKNDVDPDKLDGTGVYCYVSRKDNEISIHQDFCGCYGLYAYEDKESGFFAISNSFLKLVEYLKDKVPISLDFDFARSFIPVTLTPFNYGRTLINEIKALNKNLIVKIDIAEKSINYVELSYGEKSVELESIEALNILDAWFNKWVGIFNNVYSQTDKITLELSGGFDTRVILSLALYSQMDLTDINVFANSSSEKTKMADLKISTKIAEHFNFELNKASKAKRKYFNSIEEPINLSLYSKLGFSKMMYWKVFSYNPTLFVITGLGGGTLKKIYKHPSVERFISSNKHISRKYSQDIADSRNIILKDAFEQYSKMGDNLTDEELFNLHYIHSRNRNWCAKNAAEAVLYNEIKLNPFFDPLINKLNCNVDKDYIVHALVFLRYCPDLLNFEFEGSREISSEAMDFAKRINDVSPFSLDESNKEKITITRKPDIEIPDENNTTIFPKQIRDHFQEIYESDYFKNLFLMYFPEEIYEFMGGDHKHITAAISIMKLIEYVHFNQLKFSNSNEEWFNLCLNESKNMTTR